MYKVVETFKSIQSEGTHAGTPATFIRFYGCNLQCKFGSNFKCDEPLHTIPSEIVEMSTEEILLSCRGINHVVITGGEPSLNNINPLIEELKSFGHYVQVETNGFQIRNIIDADWITYSPKHTWSDDNSKLVDGFNELKLLGSEEFPPNYEHWRFVDVKYLQPIGLEDGFDLDNVRWCADWVVNHPDWKLSLQCHKIYGGQ